MTASSSHEALGERRAAIVRMYRLETAVILPTRAQKKSRLLALAPAVAALSALLVFGLLLYRERTFPRAGILRQSAVTEAIPAEAKTVAAPAVVTPETVVPEPVKYRLRRSRRYTRIEQFDVRLIRIDVKHDTCDVLVRPKGGRTVRLRLHEGGITGIPGASQGALRLDKVTRNDAEIGFERE